MLSFRFSVDLLLHTFFVLYCRCIVLSLFRALAVAHFRSVAHFRCFVFSLFYTFFVLHVLLFRIFAVLYFRFFSIFCFTRFLLCTFLFNTYLVMHFQFPWSQVPMILSSMFPNIYVPDFLIPQYPPPPQHILSSSVCTLFRNFTSVVLHVWLDPYIPGLYNVSRSLCSPGGPTYVPSPSVSYFCCFVLSLICTFVVSYFLYFVVS